MSRRKGRIVMCLRCRNLKKYEARGLCKCCYNHVRENRVAGKTLDDYPLLRNPTDPTRPTTAGKRRSNHASTS